MKLNPLILSTIFAVVLCLGAIPTAATAKQLVIATLNQPPMVDNDSGKAHGPLPDFIREVMRRAGIQIQIITMPWKRALASSRSGTVDAIFPASKTHFREDYLLFPKVPLWHQNIIALVQKGASPQLQANLANAGDFAWGVGHGFSYGKELNTILSSLPPNKIHPLQDMDKLLRMLKKGRVSLVITSWEVGKLVLNSRTGETLDFMRNADGQPRILAHIPNYLAFSQRTAKRSIIKKFEQAIQQARRDGTFNMIYTKYFGAPHP